MKAKILVFTQLCCGIAHVSLGQEPSASPVKRFNIHDISVTAGSLSEPNSETLSDFRLLAPTSALLNNDFTGYSDNNDIQKTTYGSLSVLLGIQFRDKDKTTYKKNPLLRLGLTYYTGTNMSNSLFKETRMRYDTLTSSQTGQSIYIDSVYRKAYGMNYYSDQIRFDGSLIYRTNPDARWTFYTGIGITAGLSIKSGTEVYYNPYTYQEAYFPNGEIQQSIRHSEQSSHIHESFRNKTNFGFSA